MLKWHFSFTIAEYHCLLQLTWHASLPYTLNVPDLLFTTYFSLLFNLSGWLRSFKFRLFYESACHDFGIHCNTITVGFDQISSTSVWRKQTLWTWPLAAVPKHFIKQVTDSETNDLISVSNVFLFGVLGNLGRGYDQICSSLQLPIQMF